MCFLWALSAHHTWFERHCLCPAPENGAHCSILLGVRWGPRADPQACGEGGHPDLKHATNWALLGFAEQGLLSPTELQRHHQQAQVTLQGWHIPRYQSKRADSVGGRWPRHTAPCLFTVGAAGLWLQEEPVNTKHGSMVFKELSDWLRLLAAEEEGRGLHMQAGRKHKTGLRFTPGRNLWTSPFTRLCWVLPGPWVQN